MVHNSHKDIEIELDTKNSYLIYSLNQFWTL
jgi:hypothetical protein